MEIFNCNQKWPICLYDFAFKNKNPSYLCLKVEADLSSYILEDYYYCNFAHVSQQTSKYTPYNYLINDSRAELVVERNYHLCNHKDFPNFVQNFKTRYNAKDEYLLQNTCVRKILDDDTQLHKLHFSFIEQVSEPLTTDLIQMAHINLKEFMEDNNLQ